MLSRKGGKTVRAVIFNIMQALFTQDIATKINWCGRNEKFPMKGTELLKIIRDNFLIFFCNFELDRILCLVLCVLPVPNKDSLEILNVKHICNQAHNS